MNRQIFFAQGVADTPLVVFDTSQVPFQAVAIDLGLETDLVVLSLFGTGIRWFWRWA